MNTHYYTLLLTVLICCFAMSCNRKINRVGEQPVPTIPQYEEEIDESLAKNDNKLPEIENVPKKEPRFKTVTVEKSACYGGGCNSYSFSLYNDGVAFYACKSGCEPRLGQFYGYIGKEKVQEIIGFIEQQQMLSLNRMYPINGKPVPNIPFTKFVLAVDAIQKKEIVSYHHQPESLYQLEEAIQYIIKHTNWKMTYQ